MTSNDTATALAALDAVRGYLEDDVDVGDADAVARRAAQMTGILYSAVYLEDVGYVTRRVAELRAATTAATTGPTADDQAKALLEHLATDHAHHLNGEVETLETLASYHADLHSPDGPYSPGHDVGDHQHVTDRAEDLTRQRLAATAGAAS